MASGDALFEFHPCQVEPLVTNMAALSSRNAQPHLAFDADAIESAIFSGVMPNHYAGGGINVLIISRFTSATSGNARVQIAVERQDTGLDTDADNFATAVEGNVAASGTSGNPSYTTIALSNSEIDGLLVNELARFKISREANDATNDTATGDWELMRVYITEQ